MKRNLVILIIAILVFTVIPTIAEADEYVDPPLLIGSDNPRQWAEFEGSGTARDPYLIANYTFHLGGSNPRFGIDISHTTVYFEIVNCTFYGTVIPNSGMDGYGIQLYDVINAKIHGCHFEKLLKAITLDEVNSTEVYENYFEGGYFARYNNVTDAFSKMSGTAISSSSNCWNLNVHRNIYRNCTFGMKMNHVYLPSFKYNYYFMCMNGMSMNVAAGGNVTNNQFTYSMYGLNMKFTRSVNVEDNEFYRNIIYGLMLDENCTELVITRNNFTENANDTTESAEPFILSGTSRGGGIESPANSKGNLISENIFIGNKHNALDDTGNTYDKNYWDDYYGVDEDGDGYGDTEYLVDGASLSVDENPLGPNLDGVITTTFTPITTEKTEDNAEPTTELDTTLIIVILVAQSVAILAIVFVVLKRYR